MSRNHSISSNSVRQNEEQQQSEAIKCISEEIKLVTENNITLRERMYRTLRDRKLPSDNAAPFSSVIPPEIVKTIRNIKKKNAGADGRDEEINAFEEVYKKLKVRISENKITSDVAKYCHIAMLGTIGYLKNVRLDIENNGVESKGSFISRIRGAFSTNAATSSAAANTSSERSTARSYAVPESFKEEEVLASLDEEFSKDNAPNSKMESVFKEASKLSSSKPSLKK
jgi:HKD family nuclease